MLKNIIKNTKNTSKRDKENGEKIGNPGQVFHCPYCLGVRNQWKELCKKNREKRIARLISEGVTNPYSVINKRAEAKYDDR